VSKRLTVNIIVHPQDGLVFDAYLPDIGTKTFKLTPHELRSYRIPERFIIEQLILEHYQSFFDLTPEIELVFF
jgi:hypothetical protein